MYLSGFSTYTSLVVAPCLKFKYISYFFLKSNYVLYFFFDRRHFLNCTYIRTEIWVIEKVIHIFKNWSIEVNTLFPCITKVITNKQMHKRKLHSRCVLKILNFLMFTQKLFFLCGLSLLLHLTLDGLFNFKLKVSLVYAVFVQNSMYKRKSKNYRNIWSMSKKINKNKNKISF